MHRTGRGLVDAGHGAAGAAGAGAGAGAGAAAAGAAANAEEVGFVGAHHFPCPGQLIRQPSWEIALLWSCSFDKPLLER
jgi:hypothetical protein